MLQLKERAHKKCCLPLRRTEGLVQPCGSALSVSSSSGSRIGAAASGQTGSARLGGRATGGPCDAYCSRTRSLSPRVLRADDFNLVLRSRRWAALTASAYCCSHRFMPSKTPFSQAAALAAARSIARRTARPAARAAAHAAARAAARAAHFHPSPKHEVMPGLLLAKISNFD